MSVKVQYVKCSSADEAYAYAKSKITDDYIAKFQVKADVSYDDSNANMKASGKGFDLELNFKEDHVLIDLNLSMMLRPFKKTVLSRIEGELKGKV
jgi:predicted secreted protein